MGIAFEHILDTETGEVYTRIIKPEKPKRNKGKSLLDFPNEYVVIDVETTGLNPSYDFIIELSAVKIKNNAIIDTFSTLVKPDEALYEDESSNEYYVDDFITELTGITNEMLKNAPYISDVLEQFLSFVGNSIIIGHNVNFDINFIYDNVLEILKRDFSNDFVDLLRISRKVFPDFENHKLSTLADNFKVEVERSHRAEYDCITTFKCFEFCRNYVEKNQIDIQPYYVGKHLNLNEIHANVTEFDETHPLYKKHVIFTGTLEKMSRKDAAQIVVNFGGILENGVTKKTNYLVLGNNDYCKTIKDGKSTKQKKAETLILKGQDLQIIPEDIFYELIEVD